MKSTLLFCALTVASGCAGACDQAAFGFKGVLFGDHLPQSQVADLLAVQRVEPCDDDREATCYIGEGTFAGLKVPMTVTVLNGYFRGVFALFDRGQFEWIANAIATKYCYPGSEADYFRQRMRGRIQWVDRFGDEITLTRQLPDGLQGSVMMRSAAQVERDMVNAQKATGDL